MKKEINKVFKEADKKFEKVLDELKNNPEFSCNKKEALKLEGSAHYKSKGLQPFDIYDILPCNRMTPKMIFFAFNILKYIWRICNGGNEPISDLDKIIHYSKSLKEEYIEKKDA